MKEGKMSETRRHVTVVAAASLACAVAWQCYAAISALRQAADFLPLFKGLGLELPFVTWTFILSYRYWWLVPVVVALLSADVVRRRAQPLWYFGRLELHPPVRCA